MATKKPNCEIERETEKVLQRYGLYSLPTDPLLLAHKLGIAVNNAEFNDASLSALIARRGSTTRIFVAQSETPYRKRFSLAHELGHYFLHLRGDAEIVDKRNYMFRERTPSAGNCNDSRAREVEANRFATALLMPEEFVRAEWEVNPNVSAMAKIFKVSPEAMEYRIDDLDLW